MEPEKNIENQLEQLAQAIPSGTSFVDGVMNRIETSSDNVHKQPIYISFVRRIFMRNPILKFSAAAMILIALLILYSTTNSTLYAQVIKAMKKAQTVHATNYHLQEANMVKTGEIWYKRNIGYKIVWQHNGADNLLIDDGQSRWEYQQGQNIAVKSKSISTESLPREITETSRYLDRCIKDKDRIDIISGAPCQVYVGSYPDKPDSTRLLFWVDESLRLRRFEEKVLENNAWKTIERGDIDYDMNIDISVFKPDFGSEVEIVDSAKILDDYFSLEKPIFAKEEMGLVFAVHEIQKCQNDFIVTVSSLRPTEETKREIASCDPLAKNYGDYQFGSGYQRLEDREGTSYIPIRLARFYCNGLDIQWTFFIPQGFEAGQVDHLKLELYYLYTCGKLAEKRKKSGLSDRERFNPIAILPLPNNSVSLESQLNKTYNLIKLLELIRAEIQLELMSVPFTDEEMDTFTKDRPDDGITKMWKAGNRDSRLFHAQSKKPSQISFDNWLKDRLTEIEKYRKPTSR
jgi:hypothetical protein